jgi:hypothetical protein
MDEHLHNWVFHFNPYTQLWAAIPRDHYDKYWNDAADTRMLRSTRLDTLLSILARTEGDPTRIEKLFADDPLSGSSDVRE